MPKPASDWITLTEAAEILAAANIKVSRSTLARWAQAGRLQSIRPGRRIYVRRSEVRALLRPHRGGVPVWDASGPPDELQEGLFDDIEG